MVKYNLFAFARERQQEGSCMHVRQHGGYSEGEEKQAEPQAQYLSELERYWLET